MISKDEPMKLQRMNDLETEMRKVARSQRAAPEDAALPSVESAAVLIRLLTMDEPKSAPVLRP